MPGTTPPTAPPIPTGFTYFDNRHSPRGERMAAQYGRFVKGGIDLPEETVLAMGRDRARGDVLSDRLIEAAFAGSYQGKIRAMVEQALDHGIETVQDAPPELTALFERLDTDPEWLDWDRVERGARVFRRYGVDAFTFFGLISLNGYRLEHIAKPLVLTGAYTGGTAFGRYLETCRFWSDISEPGALRPGGRGRRTAVTVRIMHSMIRRVVAPHPEWDGERLGVPINQFDLLSTIRLSFVLNQQTRLLGYWPSQEEILAHMHMWRYVGYLLGAEPAFYPETVEDWWRVSLVHMLATRPQDGPDNKRLGQSFVNAFGPGPDDRGSRRLRKEREYREVLGYTRFFLPREVYDVMGLPPAGPWRWLPLTRVVPNLAMEGARRLLPGVASSVDLRRRLSRTAWLEGHLEGREAKFTPVERLTR